MIKIEIDQKKFVLGMGTQNTEIVRLEVKELHLKGLIDVIGNTAVTE